MPDNGEHTSCTETSYSVNGVHYTESDKFIYFQ